MNAVSSQLPSEQSPQLLCETERLRCLWSSDSCLKGQQARSHRQLLASVRKQSMLLDWVPYEVHRKGSWPYSHRFALAAQQSVPQGHSDLQTLPSPPVNR